jgi:hypothetical protein
VEVALLTGLANNGSVDDLESSHIEYFESHSVSNIMSETNKITFFSTVPKGKEPLGALK